MTETIPHYETQIPEAEQKPLTPSQELDAYSEAFDNTVPDSLDEANRVVQAAENIRDQIKSEDGRHYTYMGQKVKAASAEAFNERADLGLDNWTLNDETGKHYRKIAKTINAEDLDALDQREAATFMEEGDTPAEGFKRYQAYAVKRLNLDYEIHESRIETVDGIKVYKTTTEFDPIDDSKIIDVEPVDTTAESIHTETNTEATEPAIVGNNLRGAKQRHEKAIVGNNLRGADERHKKTASTEVSTERYDHEGTLIFSEAEKARLRQEDQDLAKLIKAGFKMTEWSEPTLTDTNKAPVAEIDGQSDIVEGEDWGEVTYTNVNYDRGMKRVKNAFAKARAALTNLAYDAKDQLTGKEHRKRNIIGGVLGVVAVGAFAYLETRGHSVTGGSGSVVTERHHGSGALHNIAEQHKPAVHEFTLKHGDTVWDKVDSYAAHHGHHLSEEQKHFLTGKVLHANHKTWGEAPTFRVGEKFHFDERQFNEWLKESAKHNQ